MTATAFDPGLIKKKLENLTSKNGKRYNYKIVETK